MTNRPKRKITKRSLFRQRALYSMIIMVVSVMMPLVFGVLAISSDLIVYIGVLLVVASLSGLGYLATYELAKLQYVEVHLGRSQDEQTSKQQTENIEAAVKQGMIGAITELVQNGTLAPTLKEAIREVIREELAHSNLADKEVEPTLPADEVDEDSDTDTSQQNH